MNTQENRERMLKIVDDTVEYYSEDVSRRAYCEGACKYRMPGEDGEVKKCALGRYIRDEMYHESMEGLSCTLPDKCARLGTIFDDILVPEARGLPMNFWEDLQMLHDGNHNWITTGLSEAGEDRVDALKTGITQGNYDI